MKTRNKTIVMVEIAIMLCSLFLVAIPAIAAEQPTQKVIANTITTTSASEDDYVLGIYGNANEDDTIDMRDLTYVKRIFFGKKPETELSDAKYDGKINPLDFIQIKLIIVGKEKELTIVQYLKKKTEWVEEPVTVPLPIESIVVVSDYDAEALCAFGVADKIIGVTNYLRKKGELRTFLEYLPSVGETSTKWDMEKILELKPDIVLGFACWGPSDERKLLDAAGITLVQMDFYKPVKYSKEMMNLGYLLNKKERAEELINFEQQHLDLIEGRVKDLKDEQKPRVYREDYKDYATVGPGSSSHEHIIACGGINIFDDLGKSWAYIDPEAVIERNPQVIIRYISTSSVPCGYDETDACPMQEVRNDIMNRPGWDHIDAVRDGRVYIISTDTRSIHPSVWHSYVARWFHPELFKDVDPEAIHREWIETFLGVEYRGVYAYPAYPVS